MRRRAKQSSGEESGEELGAKKFLKDSRVIFLFCLQLLEEPSSKRKPKAKAGGKGKTKGKVATSKKTAPADDSNDGYVLVVLFRIFSRSFYRSFVRSFVCSFVRFFVCSFVRSFVRLFVCAFVRLFVRVRCSFVRSYILAFVSSFSRLFFHPFVCFYILSLVPCFLHEFLHFSLFYVRTNASTTQPFKGMFPFFCLFFFYYASLCVFK